MKSYLFFLVFILITGCKYGQYKRQFVVAKSDDANWTTSAAIECDSVDMITEHHAVYWIDGHKFNLKGQILKIATNPYFNQ